MQITRHGENSDDISAIPLCASLPDGGDIRRNDLRETFGAIGIADM